MQIDVDATLAEEYEQNIGPLREMIKHYHADPDYRSRVEADPIAILREMGINAELQDDIEVRVTANTDDVLYVVMPRDPNADLSDEMLDVVAGGDTVGCAGSVFTGGSVATSTAPSSVSSISTTGTAGSN